MGSVTGVARIGVLTIVLPVGLLMLAHAADSTVEKKRRGRASEDSARLVLQYAEALTTGKAEDWAAVDLGCLARRRDSEPSAGTDNTCWEDTMNAHRILVADDPEPGVFGAAGRGIGLGLISETHRQADTWKNYPPAIFVSPAVVKETTPRIAVKKVWPARTIAIQEQGKDPVAVRGSVVEVRVMYPNPLTARWRSSRAKSGGPTAKFAGMVRCDRLTSSLSS